MDVFQVKVHVYISFVCLLIEIASNVGASTDQVDSFLSINTP